MPARYRHGVRHAAEPMSTPATARVGQISAVLLTAVWISELGFLLSRLPALASIATVGLGVFVVLALLRASHHIRVLFLLVTVASVSIALALDDASVLLRGFERAQIFGAFFPSVLLLRATVDVSPRIDRLRQGLSRLSRAQARNWTLYGAHGLGAVLNVGAMAILAPVVAREATEEERAVLAGSAARGIGTAVMWSPFFVAMAFISQLVPAAALWQAILAGAGIALIGLLLSHLMFTRELGAAQFVRSVRQLGVLVLPMAVMVGSVVACSLLASVTGLQAVALLLPLLCGAYLATRGGAVAGTTARRALASFGRLADELLIVVGALVLGVAIASAPQIRELAAAMTPTLISGAPLLALLILVLVGLGQIGLHPMIGASIVVPVIAIGSFGINPVVLVAATVFAWGLSASISIWTLPVAVAATTFNVPVARLWTGKSAAYAALLGVAGIAYFALLNAWLAGGSDAIG